MAESSCAREDSDGCESEQKSKDFEDKEKRGSDDCSEAAQDSLECAVCLQVCVHPVQLPCGHIFCFLCVKGIANQSTRCAMCRQEIPDDFLDHPLLVHKDDLSHSVAFEDGQQWYYEGRNGWWQYDERTSIELETAYKRGDKTCELLIAGFLYVVHFDNMVQMRRNDPYRRRRIKRDSALIPKKGVAGLRVASTESSIVARELADGEEIFIPGGVPIAVTTSCLPPQTSDLSANASPCPSPIPPNNTPQTPHTPSASSERSSPEVASEYSLSTLIHGIERLQLNREVCEPSGNVDLQQLCFPSHSDLDCVRRTSDDDENE